MKTKNPKKPPLTTTVTPEQVTAGGIVNPTPLTVTADGSVIAHAVYPMPQYEYHLEGFTAEQAPELFTRLGGEGWEFVGMIPGKGVWKRVKV